MWPVVKAIRSSSGFAYGVATLAYLYQNLGQALRVNAKELSGCMDILVLSYFCPSGETGSEVVQAIYPKVCNVRPQIGAKISRPSHSFRHDDCRRGQVDSVHTRGDKRCLGFYMACDACILRLS
ncbi:hypothetical protein M9H77_09093 [Catharanthus roseus]|uniref:Uncharacterized protein n=1 Tax=Catharanthus roseus TaxID=4058 RepID=A0ACC0BZK8_CATRO|nr:hypothetical protein M9H77_09093 [Catharanthus roseus]